MGQNVNIYELLYCLLPSYKLLLKVSGIQSLFGKGQRGFRPKNQKINKILVRFLETQYIIDTVSFICFVSMKKSPKQSISNNQRQKEISL